MNKRKLKDRKSIRYVTTFLKNTKIPMTYKVAFVKFIIINGWIIKYFIEYNEYVILNKFLMVSFKQKKNKITIDRPFNKVITDRPFLSGIAQVKSYGSFTEKITPFDTIYDVFHRFFIFKAITEVAFKDPIKDLIKTINLENFKLLIFTLSNLNCSKIRFIEYINGELGAELFVVLSKEEMYVVQVHFEAEYYKVFLNVYRETLGIKSPKVLVYETSYYNISYQKEFNQELLDDYKNIFYTMLNEKRLDRDVNHLAQILSIVA